MKRKNRWLVVVLYAVAMAWVESAVVYYLRTMVDRIEPYQATPLPLIGRLGPVELARELATLVMLLTVGILAGRNWRERFGYTAIAFGVWDIFYYVFLKAMCDWPDSLLDWDILFLLPLPWWGPVIAPVSIAFLMVIWGTLATQGEAPRDIAPCSWRAGALCGVGMALALYAFMADALRVAGEGTEALRKLLPVSFNWLLFGAALVLMAVPVAQMCGARWLARASRRVAAPPGQGNLNVQR
ncbi:MAG TPA: hypothetical protein VJA21_15250 [Verrucomicrobiae bacterium]